MFGVALFILSLFRMFNRRLQINILRTDPGDQVWELTLQEIVLFKTGTHLVTTCKNVL